ncbi:hypothetical protein CBR_g52630 [Chara braunii]|uniref:Uncharacterized protein n=1 Tax=Chara braunii TaxID=69332 RepID=A0A388MAJ7_CHABU|nr:hypothetical protein CBR_g52630 [Chara braunii]|eukprot:GBG91594.1 hypothetical protein CBR_g52630 [Chara braunii]
MGRTLVPRGSPRKGGTWMLPVECIHQERSAHSCGEDTCHKDERPRADAEEKESVSHLFPDNIGCQLEQIRLGVLWMGEIGDPEGNRKEVAGASIPGRTSVGRSHKLVQESVH